MERDYFPDLAALRQKAALLERRAANDFKGAVAVRRAGRKLLEHEESLAAKDKEDEQDVVALRDGGVRRNPRPLHRETVQGFHARVTSEDNHDFHESMKEEVHANEQRLKEVFQNPYPALTNGPSHSGRVGRGSETPLLASDQFTAPHHRIAAPKNQSTSNPFFFPPTAATATTPLPVDGSQRKQLTNGSSAQELMPQPAPKRASGTAIISAVALTNQTDRDSGGKAKQSNSSLAVALVHKNSLVEYLPKSRLEKRVEPSRTRFPVTTTTTTTLARLPLHGQNNGDGNGDSTTDYSTDATTDIDAPMPSIEQDRRARARKAQRESDTLVAMTPLIVPGRGGEPASPITTWGSVSETPLVLGGMDTDMNSDSNIHKAAASTSYSLPTETNRDRAARQAEAKMIARVHSSKRQSKHSKPVGRRGAGAGGRTPLPDRAANLTPAAQKLLRTSVLRSNSSVRSASALSSSLRSSYTPQRQRSSSRRDKGGSATPKLTPRVSTGTNTRTKTSGNITDGLLKIP